MPSHESQATSHQSPVTAFNSFSFTLLSKNASANHLESHSCKNKGLKVPCFHTLTKNIGGRGAMRRLRVVPSERSESRDLSFGVTPLDSALTSKRAPKPFRCNTYEKHTQGGGSPVTSHQSPVTSHQSPVTSHQSRITSHVLNGVKCSHVRQAHRH